MAGKLSSFLGKRAGGKLATAGVVFRTDRRWSARTCLSRGPPEGGAEPGPEQHCFWVRAGSPSSSVCSD
eukprot:81897-Pyramimonas_sp.AAC.1